jgi:hypothetical protein
MHTGNESVLADERGVEVSRVKAEVRDNDLPLELRNEERAEDLGVMLAELRPV